MTALVRRGTVFGPRGEVLAAPRDPRLDRAAALFSIASGAGQYTGARMDLRSLREWTPTTGSADYDSLADLPTLRARSRDLARNAPLAGGAISTVCTNAVGTGLNPQPRIGREYLAERFGVTDAAADAFERLAAELFRYHSESRFFDVAGGQTHAQLQVQVLRAVLESGDVFLLRRRKSGPGRIAGHALQVVEADRVSNPIGVPDVPGFAAGVETDRDGAPIAYQVASQHTSQPAWGYGALPVTWTRVLARGPSGRSQVRHPAWKKRPEQTRGVPYLANVIEPLKQLDRYASAELFAAVLAGYFTVFIKSDYGSDLLPTDGTSGVDAAGKPLPPNYKLGEGKIVSLLPGEDVSIANPGRPNALFDPFVQSILQQIGAGIELPYEMLIKRFMASYSAARASRLEAWKFLSCVRGFLAADVCQPDWEDLLTECVALGVLEAPGFFADPLARAAWLTCVWVGPSPGQIDERGEVEAAALRVETGLSTLEAETAQLTGGNWEQNHRQAAKERRMRQEAGLDQSVAPATTSPGAAAAPPPPTPGTPEERDAADAAEGARAEQAWVAIERGLVERATAITETASAAVLGAVRETAEALSRSGRADRQVLREALARVAQKPVVQVRMPAIALTVEAPKGGTTKHVALEHDADGLLVGAHVTEQPA